MCRSVADAALMLQPMAGYDPRGIVSIEADIPDYAGALRRRMSAMRLGVPRAFYEDVDPQVLTAVERALGVLGDLTAGARDVELPPLPAARTVGVEAYAYHADLLEERRGLYAGSTLARIEGGAEMSAADYAEARHELALVRKAVAAAFDHVDVLVTPMLVELPVSIADDARARGSKPQADRLSDGITRSSGAPRAHSGRASVQIEASHTRTKGKDESGVRYVTRLPLETDEGQLAFLVEREVSRKDERRIEMAFKTDGSLGRDH